MLTIGQLAAHAGVTVRAVRHYHHCGLLAEPERDSSGYRRYDAAAVVDLIRIKTMADAGVPLARIDELLHAGQEEFAEAVAAIDDDLRARIRDLTRQRRRIAELVGGERLFLPAEVVAVLERLRALGVSERTIRIERDMWIMMAAQSPELLPELLAVKNASFDDAELMRLYLTCDEAFDWDPRDPRLVRLAADMKAWAARQQEHEDVGPGTRALLDAHLTASSPAWERLMSLVAAP
ncbi:MerR family transcriptional regulator [Nonomuraea roseoviolacea]|uniref:DNA-binding transcriptional MerR regulator n=1 Tax=Nonomuraea roseoviolacea subsp. carminata TaxID=160689 RepID=A0ABT1K4X3_9ACTN|nr:MerR family transcriptional regulator [Nonomuraea roseoviolacea]MCP2349055.1 DNA-binding transcriptional MerR regulator [Nonomuraea roseoviolacea subsp. carminata]